MMTLRLALLFLLVFATQCVAQDGPKPERERRASADDAVTIVAVEGAGRVPASLVLTPANDLELTLGSGKNQIRLSSQAVRPPKTQLVRWLARRELDEGGNVATVNEFAIGSDQLLIWTNIRSVSPENLASMRVERTPFCIVQMVNAAGVQMVPLDRSGAPAEERLLPPPPTKFREGKLWGYRDVVSNQVLIAPQFLNARAFGDAGRLDLAMVRTAGGWGFVDRQGRLVIAAKYERFEDRFLAEQIVAYVGGLAGLVHANGHELLVPKFVAVRAFLGAEPAWAPVRTTQGWGFADRSGAMVIPTQFADVGWFGEAGAPAQDAEGNWGYIDRAGSYRIQPQFAFALPHQEGLGLVMLDGKWGAIDASGKLLIPAVYDQLRGFRNGRSEATKGGVSGWLSVAGVFTAKGGVGSDGAKK